MRRGQRSHEACLRHRCFRCDKTATALDDVSGLRAELLKYAAGAPNAHGPAGDWPALFAQMPCLGDPTMPWSPARRSRTRCASSSASEAAVDRLAGLGESMLNAIETIAADHQGPDKQATASPSCGPPPRRMPPPSTRTRSRSSGAPAPTAAGAARGSWPAPPRPPATVAPAANPPSPTWASDPLLDVISWASRDRQRNRARRRPPCPPCPPCRNRCVCGPPLLFEHRGRSRGARRRRRRSTSARGLIRHWQRPLALGVVVAAFQAPPPLAPHARALGFRDGRVWE